MSDISTIYVNETSYDIKDATARSGLASKAPLASPAFTGTPTTPTAAAGTNTTQIASTAFVKTAVDNAIGSAVRFKGTKATVAEVKAITSATVGDLWIVTADNSEWVCTQTITVATPSAWEELGKPVEDLGALAYKDSASGSYTPAGSVTSSAAGTTTVNSITAVGTLPTHAADTFTQGTLPTFSASVTNEVLSFSFSAGTLPTYTQGTFSQGTLPTKGANQTVATEGVKGLGFSGTAATIEVS